MFKYLIFFIFGVMVGGIVESISTMHSQLSHCSAYGVPLHGIPELGCK